MELQLQIKLDEIFFRDPEESEPGKKIILHSIRLINENGLEAFTFKKPAEDNESSKGGILQSFFC